MNFYLYTQPKKIKTVKLGMKLTYSYYDYIDVANIPMHFSGGQVLNYIGSKLGQWFSREPWSKPINMSDMAIRQAYAESGFDPAAKSHADAYGLYQIRQDALTDYNKANNTQYTISDLSDNNISADVRDWYMNFLQNRPWNQKDQLAEVQYAKSLAAYNWGPGNLVNMLNKIKDEVDIYNSFDWVQYMPIETLNYVNFILRGTTFAGGHNNKWAYQKAVRKNPEIVRQLKLRHR